MKLDLDIDKDKLHHAYLIEGRHPEIVPEIKKIIKNLGISVTGNPEFVQLYVDTFKIEDAINLKSFASEKAFSSSKKIFIVTVNNFLLEAQNSMLKVFEEPIENTHFFLIVPDINSLLKTLASRFYLIRKDRGDASENALKFIKMPLHDRIDFIKDLVSPSEGEEENMALDSLRSESMNFLNALEISLYSKFWKNFDSSYLLGIAGGSRTARNFSKICFPHFFKVREFLRMPGSSVKNLMESVALIIPQL